MVQIMVDEFKGMGAGSPVKGAAATFALCLDEFQVRETCLVFVCNGGDGIAPFPLEAHTIEHFGQCLTLVVGVLAWVIQDGTEGRLVTCVHRT